MHLATIDWIIIAVYMLGCIAAGVWMRRYVRNVEDFAVAGREMDLNLGIASLAATEVGIVTVMYTAETGFSHGLAGATPGVLGFLMMLLVGITGFVIVPLRNSGVITIPELFEKRYGKRVRWLAGLVIILGGVLNMGIFLRVGGDFLMYVTGLDSRAGFEIHALGTAVRFGYLEVMMTSLLAIVLVYTVLGGMISVLVTDYLQFLVMGAGIVVTSILVVYHVGWTKLLDGIWNAHVTHQTLLDTSKDKAVEVTMAHPFNPLASYGWLWVTWQAITEIAIMTTWQTTIARVLAARDSATAKRIYRRTSFYFVGRFALPGLWGIGAFLFFASQPGGLRPGMSSLTAMPAYLGTILGPGLLGLMVAAMLAAEMSTDSGYLLTWATVIYNDLVSPVLRRPLSERSRLLIVRLLVLAIGLFLVFYGLWFQLKGSAWDYLAVTGNIYLASLFALLVGALYWRWTNSWGAIAAIVLGAVGPISFLVANWYLDQEHQIAPEIAGWAAFLLAFAGMIGGSLLGRAMGVRRLDLAANETKLLPEEVTS